MSRTGDQSVDWHSGASELMAFIRFSDPDRRVTILDISSALFDFNVLYEIALLAGAPEYQSAGAGSSSEGRSFWTRSGRRIRPQDRLSVVTIDYASPLELLVAIPATVAASGTAVWAVVQAWERIIDRPLNRSIRQSEAERAFYEARSAQLDYEKALRDRELVRAEERARLRIERNIIRPEEIELQ